MRTAAVISAFGICELQDLHVAQRYKSLTMIEYKTVIKVKYPYFPNNIN